MEVSFTLLIGLMLFARLGFRRDVPMAAFYLACAAWAVKLVWAPVSGSMDWALSALGLVERYSAPPSVLSLVDVAVSTVTGLALIVAVLIAARSAEVRPTSELQNKRA